VSDVRPARRVVLLGASNLTQGISTIVETAQNMCRQPIEVLAAAGWGRSYGIDSRVMGRTLPSIIHCSLWEALAEKTAVSTTALVTDVGNDILYGVEVPQIVRWVDTALDQLQQAQAQVCLTLPPRIEQAELSAGRFRFFRGLFFPGCRLNREEVIDRAVELHDRLQRVAKARGIGLVTQRRHWYGWDPIHIRRRHWPYAWREILSLWEGDATPAIPPARGSLTRWLYLQTRRPHQQHLFGLKQRRIQPSARLRDGTTISFF
jgi:hypothetical protein